MSDFFFAKQNEDGTYGEPIKAEIVDLDFTTQGVGDPTPIPSFKEDMEMSFELGYKQTKDFVWNVILNLKRSTKRLVSKNIAKEKSNAVPVAERVSSPLRLYQVHPLQETATMDGRTCQIPLS